MKHRFKTSYKKSKWLGFFSYLTFSRESTITQRSALRGLCDSRSLQIYQAHLSRRTNTMNIHQYKPQPLKAVLTQTASAVALLLLAACGGGSGSSGSSASTPSSPTNLGGTVAVGDPLVGATVTLVDANGRSATATSDAKGNYSLSIAGLSAPFFLVSNDPSGVNAPMYSVTANVPTGTTTPIVANITPLTTAVAAGLTPDGNPTDLTTSSTLVKLVTPASVSQAVAALNTILGPILTADQVSASSFNPISTAFTPNQTGPDAVIDSVIVNASSSGGMQIASIAAPNTTVPLSSAMSSSSVTPIVAPAIPANYLDSLVSELSSCLSGTTSACSTAIDANYQENGYNSSNGGFEAYHADLSASDTVITGAKTLVYWAAGQSPFPNITAPSALVRIFYTTAAGKSDFALTVVQQTQAATSAPAVWDIVGNQQAYDVTINSFVATRQFLDAADAPGSRYESGLNIGFAVNSASPVNPANVGSVNVTGPGLPTGGIWLEPRTATGNDTFALTSRVTTSAPTVATTSSSNTSLYRWSWQSLPTDTGTFAFSVASSDAGYYAPIALTAQTLPPAFASYTATVYDTTGTELGQSTVINSTAALLSNAGQDLLWPTLGSDVGSNFLSPSGALAGVQSSVAIDWSGLINGQNIAPSITGVQIQDDVSAGSTVEVDGWWTGVPTGQNGQYAATVTAGVSQNGVQTCTSPCSFSALTTGASRLVDLTWGAEGVSYYSIAKYDD